MPRYYIDTFNDIAAIDDEGQELPDEAAVRRLVRRSLAAMMKDEGDSRSAVQLRADVRDARGKRVMTASLLMVIDRAKDENASGAT